MRPKVRLPSEASAIKTGAHITVRRLVHALIALGVFLIVAGLHWLDNTGRGLRILERWEYGFRDMLTRAGRLNPPDSRLFFLARDTDSMLPSDDLEFYKDVPPEDHRALTIMTARIWSREVYALLCERLLTGGARAVVFDMAFLQPDVGDDAFQRVLQKFPDRIVLASDLAQGRQVKAWSLPTSILPDASPEHPAIGYDTLLPEFDGKVRRALFQTTLEQLQGGIQPDEKTNASAASLSLRAATKLEPVKVDHPFQRHLFRYTGPPGTFPPVSMYEVFAYWESNFRNGERIRDKVVIVGDSGSLMHDEALTPFGTMPGPEVHLNFVNALLHHQFLHELPPWTGTLLIILAVVAAWLLTVLVQKTWLRAIAFVLLAAGYIFSVILAYNRADTVILAIPPVLAFGVARPRFLLFMISPMRPSKLRIGALSKYVSKDVVREVLDNPESYLQQTGRSAGKRRADRNRPPRLHHNVEEMGSSN